MKFFLTALILLPLVSFSQMRIYTGFIDKSPITLMAFNYSDGAIHAYYSYDKYDTPILTYGELKKGTMKLYERDANDSLKATFVFKEYKGENETVTGKWVNASTKKSIPVTLKKVKEFDNYDDKPFSNLEILAPESSKQHYYKLVVSMEMDDEAYFSKVKIYEKGTDRFIQELDLEGKCEYRIFSLNTGDYNFDDVDDFSVFVQSYAGPNSGWKYILRNTNAETYFISDYEEVALEFDYETKQIYEVNSCCAGSFFSKATYKVENNKMVLLEEHCYRYSEEAEDYLEEDCDE